VVGGLRYAHGAHAIMCCRAYAQALALRASTPGESSARHMGGVPEGRELLLRTQLHMCSTPRVSETACASRLTPRLTLHPSPIALPLPTQKNLARADASITGTSRPARHPRVWGHSACPRLAKQTGGCAAADGEPAGGYHKPKGVRCCTCACLKLWLYANARACVRAIVRACVHTPFFVVGFVLGRACVSVCLCVCVHRACVHVHVCVCARVRVNVECVCCV